MFAANENGSCTGAFWTSLDRAELLENPPEVWISGWKDDGLGKLRKVRQILRFAPVRHAIASVFLFVFLYRKKNI